MLHRHSQKGGRYMKKLLGIVLILSILAINAMPAMAGMVLYNTKTGKFHNFSCRLAKKCTVNCIKIDRKEAIKRRGVACKVCRG